MSVRHGVVSLAAMAILIALAGVPGPANAAVGDVLRTVTLPAGAAPDSDFCTSGLATSIALVPGAMVGLPQHPVLLVTSCFITTGVAAEQAQGSKLFFFLPVANPGPPVLTVTTSITPQNGWGALALRGEKNDLLGCGSEARDPAVNTHRLYSIPLQKTLATTPNPTVTPTVLFSGQAGHGFSICDGVAWDAANNEIYQGPDVFHSVFRYSEAGTLLSTIPAPAGCKDETPVPGDGPTNSGVAIGGQTLFLGCADDNEIYQIDKNGNVIQTINAVDIRTEDLECDPVTFGGQGVDAVWSKSARTNEIVAYEIPKGTCGFAGGAAVATPAQGPLCAIDGVTDSDGDGLLDCWEKPSPASAGAGGRACIDYNGDGLCDVVLCVDSNRNGVIDTGECADYQRKDVFVELDWLQGHMPNQAAITAVINKFSAAPVSNPNNVNGVRLHVLVDEALKDGTGTIIPHNATTNVFMAFEPYTGPAPAGVLDFDMLKRDNFGLACERAAAGNCPLGGLSNAHTLNAKRQAFRYGIFGHLLNLPPLPPPFPANSADTTSGASEVHGNDFVVTLGDGFGTGSYGGTSEHQAGTFMHEIGHALGLRHGGNEFTNCKPNYLSVMSYTRQFSGSPISSTTWLTWALDYSSQPLGLLTESTLNEQAGIGAAACAQPPSCNVTVHGPGSGSVVRADGSINWDGDTNFNENPAAPTDINSITGTIDVGGTPVNVTICDGTTTVSYQGFNDWANLKYDIRSSTDFADGVRFSLLGEDRELSLLQAYSISQDSDGDEVVDFVDNCDDDWNPDQADANGDGQGDACTVVPVSIDIKPGDSPNTINLGSGGTVPVAILGSATFNALDVIPETIVLGGANVRQNRTGRFSCSAQNVNGDAFPDLLCHIETEQLTLSADAVVAVLTARTSRTTTNRPIRGEDTIHVVR